jgi:hypothetical protein
MGILHLAFQEGFEGDTVIVRIDGKEVYRKEHVTTRYQINYADSFKLHVDEESVNVEILIPAKELSKKFSIKTANTVYVKVLIQMGEIKYSASDKPLRYL